MSKERLQQILDECQTLYNVFQASEKSLLVKTNGLSLVEFFTKTNEVHQHEFYDEVSTCVQREINTALAKYIVEEDELRNKKYKYKVPKFLCDGSLIYLCRDIIDEYFFISYGKFSDEVLQSFFTAEEIEKLIEEYGEDFKTFIEMCEKVEVE